MNESKGETWTEVLRPIVERWQLCAKMGLHFSETPDGCGALAELVGGMAAKLDGEIERQRMVMMGPGFFSSGGSIFGPLIGVAIGGWIVAIVVGLCWLIFG